MKDDKWICHIGKEITLSSYDRLAWFVCVPKSPDGGAKYVGFQGLLTSISLCTSPVMGLGHLPWGFWSPATQGRWRGHDSQGRTRGSARMKLRHTCRAWSTQQVQIMAHLFPSIRVSLRPLPKLPVGALSLRMTWSCHRLVFSLLKEWSLVHPVGMLFSASK